MDLHPGLRYLPALLAQALLLMVLSRVLFQAMVSAFADRKGGGLVTLLRMPGNIIHETSHALGYLVFGYRVQHVIFCVFDPKKAGACIRGKPWAPITFPWLADGAAALMPLVIGTVALVGVGQAFGIIDHQASEPTTDMSMFRAVADQFLLLLGSLDWHRWQTYVFLYAALTIGAEISPSPTDLRYAIPALGGIALGLILMLVSSQQSASLNHMLTTAADWLLPTVRRLFGVWGLALVLMLITAAAAIPFAFVIYTLRPQRR